MMMMVFPHVFQRCNNVIEIPWVVYSLVISLVVRIICSIIFTFRHTASQKVADGIERECGNTCVRYVFQLLLTVVDAKSSADKCLTSASASLSDHVQGRRYTERMKGRLSFLMRLFGTGPTTHGTTLTLRCTST